MYAYIKGELVHASPLNAVVEAGGIGYQIQIPANVFGKLPQCGSTVLLHTSYVVRELSQTLYGFLSIHERDMFETLMGVTGIGPRLALSINGHISLHDLQHAVSNGDIPVICRVPGIGKKTAERIVIELRDRVDGLTHVPGTHLSGASAPLDAAGEATVALQQLGYKPAEVTRLVQKVSAEGDSAEAIIRKALRAALGG